MLSTQGANELRTQFLAPIAAKSLRLRRLVKWPSRKNQNKNKNICDGFRSSENQAVGTQLCQWKWYQSAGHSRSYLGYFHSSEHQWGDLFLWEMKFPSLFQDQVLNITFSHFWAEQSLASSQLLMYTKLFLCSVPHDVTAVLKCAQWRGCGLLSW